MVGQSLDPRSPPRDTLGSLGELINYTDPRLRLNWGPWTGAGKILVFYLSGSPGDSNGETGEEGPLCLGSVLFFWFGDRVALGLFTSVSKQISRAIIGLRVANKRSVPLGILCCYCCCYL